MMYRKTIVLAALLLALSGLFLIQETSNVRRNTLEVAALQEGVDAISITGGGDSLLLRRDGGSWLVGGEGYPGDGDLIEELLEGVADLGEVEVISGRGNYDQYELTGDTAFEIAFEQEGTEVLTLTLGGNAAAGSAVYGRVNGGPEVVLLPRRLKDRASTDPTEFREKLMASLDENELQGATVSGEGHGTIRLARRQDPELTEDMAELDRIGAVWRSEAPERLEPGVIQSFIGELSSLTAQDFLDDPPSGDPFGEILLETPGGEESIAVYPPTEGGLYPISTTLAEYDFLVPEWRARRLLFGRDGFFEPFQEEEGE